MSYDPISMGIGLAGLGLGSLGKLFADSPDLLRSPNDFYDADKLNASFGMLDLVDKAEEAKLLRRLQSLNRGTLDALLSFGKAQGFSQGFSNTIALNKFRTAQTQANETAASMPSVTAGARVNLVGMDFDAAQRAKMMAGQATNQERMAEWGGWQDTFDNFLTAGGSVFGQYAGRSMDKHFAQKTPWDYLMRNPALMRKWLIKAFGDQ